MFRVGDSGNMFHWGKLSEAQRFSDLKSNYFQGQDFWLSLIHLQYHQQQLRLQPHQQLQMNPQQPANQQPQLPHSLTSTLMFTAH